jgi:hypothetical protein
MSISINVIESNKQLIANIPEYLTIAITGTNNAIVYFTFDGTTPDQSGFSLTTKIMEHNVGDPLHGIIFLPTHENILELNMVAVGALPNEVATFYRRYGLDSRKLGIGRPGIKLPIVSGGNAIIITPSPNKLSDGTIVANDGYTEGYVVQYDITKIGFDGYIDAYGVGVSGIQTALPSAIYDHIDGYITNSDGNIDGYSTTTLTLAQEQNALRLSDRGNVYIDDGQGLVAHQQDTFKQTDPRSNTIYDSQGRVIEIIPIEDYPTDGYTIDVGANSIDINYDNAPIQEVELFTTGGMFNPRAAYIEIDGRVDGYINGQPIQPDDRILINKPFGELRYHPSKENLGTELRQKMGIITGGIVCSIFDYEKGQAAFYYHDQDNRWVRSLQAITSPQFEIFARRNGVVVGQVFTWITNKAQILPG